MTPQSTASRHSAIAGTDVTILGAGLGGLAAALALARRGAQVRVLEQAPHLSEVGAGIQVSPNGAAVLAALGLDEGLTRVGVRARAVELRDGRTDRHVLRLELARLGAGRGHFLCHRADLLGMLAEAAKAAGVQLETGRQVRAVEAGESAARLTLADGAVMETALLVGADGLHSISRPAVIPTAAPGYTGRAAWRAIVPGPAPAPERVRVAMAPGRHMVVYPLREGRLVNIVAIEERPEWTAEGWSLPGDPALLRRRFAGLAPAYAGLLERVEACHLWGLFRHPVPDVWARGRVVLLGDAVHPTLPFLAQGANMAFEDAWVLADRLARLPEVPAALESYRAARLARVRRIVDAAAGSGQLYHLGNPLLRIGAHAVIRFGGFILPGFAPSRLRWLHDHDVTAG